MDVTIAAVGKLGRSAEADLTAAYTRRLPWRCRTVEIAESRADDPVRRKRDEAARLNAALSKTDWRLMLDETGDLLTSRQLADQIHRRRAAGQRHLGIAIGGPDGLDGDFLKQDGLIVSFGRLTWPHKLVRAMLAEQLYRAWTITQGHPYHRD